MTKFELAKIIYKALYCVSDEKLERAIERKNGMFFILLKKKKFELEELCYYANRG